MTDLLPATYKVDVELAPNEEVVVPSGSVWKVDLSVNSSSVEIYITDGSGNRQGLLLQSDSPVQTTTVHEGHGIEVGNNYAIIQGWQFDYSQ